MHSHPEPRDSTSRISVRYFSGSSGAVFYHVDRRLFRGGRSAIDTDVMRDQTGLDVRVGSLVRCHQPARPGIRAVVEQEPVDVQGRIRLLF